MRNIYAYLLLLLLSSGLQSCNTLIEEPTSQNSDIILNYKIDNGISTRSFALASYAENKIEEIAAIFYDNTGNYVEHLIIPTNSSAQEGYLNIKLPGVMVAGTYNVIMLCNYNGYISDMYSDTDAYVQSLNTDYTTAKGAIEYTKSPSITELLPMCTIVEGFIISQSQNVDLILEAVFKRVVSRVDLHNFATNFQLEWAKIGNYKTGIKPFATPIYSGAISTENTEMVAVESQDGNNIIEALYCFPNMTPFSTQDDSKTTYLMIKGSYNNISYFYRVNIWDHNKSQTMLMNTIYDVNIIEVLGVGDLTEAAAASNPSSNIITNISDGSEIKVDDQNNYISVSKTRVVLSSAASSPESITVEVNPLDVWSATLDDEGLNYFTLEELAGRLTITSKNLNATADVYKGVIIIKHGGNGVDLSIKVNVIQTN